MERKIRFRNGVSYADIAKNIQDYREWDFYFAISTKKEIDISSNDVIKLKLKRH
ncbi:MAG: hypothetical protein ACFE91_11850 [Promethearchaeota archaeon]